MSDNWIIENLKRRIEERIFLIKNAKIAVKKIKEWEREIADAKEAIIKLEK